MPVMTLTAKFPEIQSRRRLLHVLWRVLGTTTSVVVSGSFAVVMAYRRDATTVAAYLGAIINGILSKLLKKMIQQARPSPSSPSSSDHSVLAAGSLTNCSNDNNGNGNGIMPRYGVGEEEGMPSSHSMSLAFIWALAALHYHPPDPSRRCLVAVVSFVYVLICATYRIQAQLHTWQQVLVGLTLGILHAGLFVRYVEPDLTTWITAHILSTTNDTDASHYNGSEQQRPLRTLPAPWLVIPFTMTILIGAKVDLRIMQWLSQKMNNSNNKTVKQK